VRFSMSSWTKDLDCVVIHREQASLDVRDPILIQQSSLYSHALGRTLISKIDIISLDCEGVPHSTVP